MSFIILIVYRIYFGYKLVNSAGTKLLSLFIHYKERNHVF